MSTPQPADGVKQAVRRVRMAAASVSNPLGLFGVAVTAAEQVPGLLEPGLEALTPSPFSLLGGLIGSGPAASKARTRTQASRPAPATSAPPPAPGPAGRATEAVSILGRFVADELVALGVTAPAPAPSRPQPQPQQGVGGDVDQILGSVLAALQPPPPPGGVQDVFTAMGVTPATREERVGSAVAVASANAGAPPVVAGAAKAAATGIAAGLGLLEELVTGERPAGDVAAPSIMGQLLAGLPQPPAPAKPAAGGTQPSRAGAAPAASAPTLDETRRRLLDPSAAAGSDPAGATVPALAAPQDPDDLAWLVNEALVEQARRHGLDLS